MKRTILSALLVSAVIILSACTSMPSTFGDADDTSRNDVKVFTDKFSGSKTYSYIKGLRGGFTLSRNAFSTDHLEFYPDLVINTDGLCTPSLRIVYSGSNGGLIATAADKMYTKFIFLNTYEKRLEIIHSVVPNMESEIERQFAGNYALSAKGEYRMTLTKKQFDVMKGFFSSSDSIECAAYSTDNTVVTFKSYNNSWHQNVFTALDNCVKVDEPDIKYNETLTQAIVR